MSRFSVLLSNFLPYIISFSSLILTTTAFPLRNITLPLPAGTSNHGTPGLLCTPTKWTDVASFYLFNYVAHAATVITRPGERSVDFAVSVLGCLLHPAMGLYRGIEAIFAGVWGRGERGRDGDLERAAKSGALCMVVRTAEWEPEPGDAAFSGVLCRNGITGWCQESNIAEDKEGVCPKSKGTRKEEEEGRAIGEEGNGMHVIVFQPPWLTSPLGPPIYVNRQIIHGTYRLPPGYGLVVVPPDTCFRKPGPQNCGQKLQVEIAATYNGIKALIALAQAVYASLTLYRSRGDQITQFGYAAFGLTVAPYAVMSMVNLFGNLCRPDYASLYMCESGVMDEARERGGVFEGAVARVDESVDEGREMIVDLDEKFSHEKVRFGSRRETGSMVAEVYGDSGKKKKEADFDVHSLPKNMDYTGTEHEALFLVPSCAAPKRTRSTPFTSTSSPASNNDDKPPSYRLQNITLCPPYPWAKARMYHVKLAPVHPLPGVFGSIRLLRYFFTLVASLMPLLINGIMSRFKGGAIPNEEASTWKVYTMQWLAFGVAMGLWWVLDQEGKDGRCWGGVQGNERVWEKSGERRWKVWRLGKDKGGKEDSEEEKGEQIQDGNGNVKKQDKWLWFGPKTRLMGYVLSASPALGGFIVVGQMLARYGVCVWVGG